MNKIENLLSNAFRFVNSSFQPEDPITWNAWEKPRGVDLSLQKAIEDATQEAAISNDGSGGECDRYPNSLGANIYLRVFAELRLIARYFAGEFVLRCPKEFSDTKYELYQIWDLFIEKWYFSYVYIGYGEDLLELDKHIIKANPQANKEVFETCKFRLYTKSGDKFYSIIAGGIVESSLVFEGRLVRCSLDEQVMWLCWFHILLEYVCGLDRCLASFKAVSKQVITTDFGQEQVNSILEQVENTSTVFRKPATSEDQLEESLYSPLKFMDSNDATSMFGMLYDYIERQASKLGYVLKPANLKKERTNSGENFALNKNIFNFQTHMLRRLNNLIFNMRMKFGDQVIPEDMTVVLSNQAYALGLPNPADEFEKGWLRKGEPDPQNEQNFYDAD